MWVIVSPYKLRLHSACSMQTQRSVRMLIVQQGTRHAEFLAIAEMLQSYPKTALQSTDLYVTVEPCVMCASALKQYRIRSVYFGCANDRFGGTGGVLTIHSESVASLLT